MKRQYGEGYLITDRLSDLNDKIDGKPQQHLNHPSRFNTQPQVNAPSPRELSDSAIINQRHLYRK